MECLVGLLPEVVAVDGREPVRIRLDPGGLERPVVAVVERVDDGEQGVVGDLALEHLDRVPALLEADPGRVEARGGDGPHERLRALPSAGAQDVVELAIWVRVQLVDRDEVEVEAVAGLLRVA